jgi:predicted RNase H-like nuclease (RuvC/YqgF family)
VRFDWKESGEPSVGLIAEEVEGVVPEVVAHGGNNGAATGVNYSALIGVLVEAVKEQQAQRESLVEIVKEQQEAMTKQEARINKQEAVLTQQQEAISQLMAEINRLKGKGMIAQR